MACRGQGGGLRPVVFCQAARTPLSNRVRASAVETTQAENRPSLVLGAALILVAAFFFVFAKDIPRTGLAGNTDPGPRALPLVMATVVAAGGMIEVLRGAIRRKQSESAEFEPAEPEPAGPARAMQATASEASEPTSNSFTNFGVLTAAMLAYLLSLAWLGFQVSTAVFASAVLMWLGARWWSAILSSLVIVMIVRVLFVGLFHVQLPEGSLGWAF